MPHWLKDLGIRFSTESAAGGGAAPAAAPQAQAVQPAVPPPAPVVAAPAAPAPFDYKAAYEKTVLENIQLKFSLPENLMGLLHGTEDEMREQAKTLAEALKPAAPVVLAPAPAPTVPAAGANPKPVITQTRPRSPGAPASPSPASLPRPVANGSVEDQFKRDPRYAAL